MKSFRRSSLRNTLAPCLAGLALGLVSLSASALTPFEVLFDFTPNTGDRDRNFAERQPAGTFDVNGGVATGISVVDSDYLAYGNKAAFWIVLNDTNPGALDATPPANVDDLKAGTNLVVRTRLIYLYAGVNSVTNEAASGGILFGLTGTGSTRSGYLARVDRANTAVGGINNYAVLHIDQFVNGVRGASLAEAGFVYGANSTLHFLELRITSNGSVTNATLKIFADADIPDAASTFSTNRLIKSAFDTATPEASLTLDLSNYNEGFLGLYAEDNSNLTENNPTAGTVRFSNFYANSGDVRPVSIVAAANGSENGTNGGFTVSRLIIGADNGPLTVNYTLSGSALNGVDYELLNGSASFNTGETSVAIPVTVLDDALIETNETVILTLTPSGSYWISGTNAASVTIYDDDARTISASASIPAAGESGPTLGEFTLFRAGNTNSSVTVYYALSGTASDGVDYASLSGSAVFGAGVTNVPIALTPIDDLLLEPAETVILTILPDPGPAATYLVSTNAASATVVIADDEPPVFAMGNWDGNAYERVPLLTGSVNVTRPLGNPNTTVTVNFSLGGTAVLGVDYTSSATNTLVFAPGVTSQTIVITPIDNSLLDGTRMVVGTLQSGSGYVVDSTNNTGTVAIVDDELAAETVLWSDNFDLGTSGPDYAVTAAARDASVDDYALDFGFDYNLAGILTPPGTATTKGLKLTVNKNDLLARSAGVNVYPTNQLFSGNYALRFNVFLNYGTFNQEQVLFGLNHSGSITNWRSSSHSNTVSGDGIWAAVNIGEAPSVTLLAATNAGQAPVTVGQLIATNLTQLFNSPPFGLPGGMGNTNDSVTKTWLDGELSQLDGIITVKFNNTVLLQYTNSGSFTAGNIMLGYNDLFDSIGSINGYAIFDNVRVVRLTSTAVTTPHIAEVNVTGTTVQVDFTAGAGDGPANFKLQHRPALGSGSFADDDTAVITTLSSGVFRATTTTNGDKQFYRISRQ